VAGPHALAALGFGGCVGYTRPSYPSCRRTRSKVTPQPNVEPRQNDEAAKGSRDGEAVTLDEGLRRTMARGGAQAIKGALHADRRVQQYGSPDGTNGPKGGGRAAAGDRSRVAVLSWGTLTRPMPVLDGLTTSFQTLPDE
jgi:hypothetical protein